MRLTLDQARQEHLCTLELAGGCMFLSCMHCGWNANLGHSITVAELRSIQEDHHWGVMQNLLFDPTR